MTSPTRSLRDTDLGIFLSAAVPLRIMAMQASEEGGPTKEQMERARKALDDLGERGDVLQYGRGKQGEVAELANQLAQCVAILAFASGGVTAFEQHFEAKVVRYE
ncbi:MAG: hypothetical protein U0350_36495 [Caldilineaceae bacterium]